jgi:hypothetical protein
MSTIDRSNLHTLTMLARDGLAAQRRDGAGGAIIAHGERALAAAELALDAATDRTARLEAALADCYSILHALRHGHGAAEFAASAPAVELAARELLGIEERAPVPVD